MRYAFCLALGLVLVQIAGSAAAKKKSRLACRRPVLSYAARGPAKILFCLDDPRACKRVRCAPEYKNCVKGAREADRKERRQIIKECRTSRRDCHRECQRMRRDALRSSKGRRPE